MKKFESFDVHGITEVRGIKGPDKEAVDYLKAFVDRRLQNKPTSFPEYSWENCRRRH